MSEMVERVARAIAVARGMNPDAKSVTAFQGSPRDCMVWESLVPSARAAIAAMREPTREMAQWRIHPLMDTDVALRYAVASAMEWRAMVDIAVE